MAGRKPSKNPRAQNNTMQSLPRDIIFPIFLQLPAKVLAVLKFFCREWYQVISDPAFVRAHLLRTRPRLVFQVPSEKGNTRIDILSLEVNRGTRNRVTLLSPRPYGEIQLQRGKKLYIRASCDGLLLLENLASANRSLVVTNPITGQWSQLPIPRPNRQGFYGFAYDRLSRKYKLVRLFRVDHEEALVCEVLTLGSDSWREVNGPPVLPKYDFTIIHNRPISVDGVVYWVNRFLDPVPAYIVSFNVGNEEFSYTPYPPEAKGNCHPLDMGGKLSLFTRMDTQLDIWILEDYRRVVWMKRYSTMMSLVNGLKYKGALLSPRAFLDDGEVLIFREGFKLFSFDLKHNKFEEIKTHLPHLKRDYMLFLDQIPFAHVNSLVNWET